MMERKRGIVGGIIYLFLLVVGVPIISEAAPNITSITPNTANNWGIAQITELVGTGFEEGARVSLVKTGLDEVAVQAIVEGATQISGRFNATGLEPGSYDVVVTNPDEQSATLTVGFTITTTPPPTIISSTPELTDNMGLVSAEITGDNFLRGAKAKLVRDGQADIEAISVMVESPNTIICEFNLTGVTLGNWHLMVINPDGQSGI